MNTTTRSVPAIPGAPRQGTGRLIVATVAAVLLGALVTAGIWAYTSSDAPRATVSTPFGLEVPVGVEATVSISGPIKTIYVVSSEEQAATLRVGLNEANQISGMTGGPLRLDAVIVLPADVPVIEMLLPGAADVVDLRNL
jgi:hypothetical protein